ncbi:hypothetical protein [Agrobacterium pusense]|uniref:hypothetical protein n=1 Tax=Agrobacterium pusense TaxID=648995 RepID=UPI000D1A20B2|nr:hypothetical protein [Agrobacterium pusense]
MNEKLLLQAISEITDPDLIRVVIFRNGEFIHAPLNALVNHLVERIEALEARVSALETPTP